MTAEIKNNIMCISLPKEIIEKIDTYRGDISRSRFVLRLIEKGFEIKDKEMRKINPKALIGLEPKSYPKPNPERYGKLMEWTKE